MTCQPNWLFTGSVGTPRSAPSAPAVKSASKLRLEGAERTGRRCRRRRRARRRSSPRRLGRARLGHLGEVGAALELVQHGLGLGLRLDQDVAGRTAPRSPAGSSRRRFEVLADGAASSDSDWTAAAPATTSSFIDCGSLAAVGLPASWPWMVSSTRWASRARAGQEVLGRLPGDELGEPAAGRAPVDGDVGRAGQVEQAGVGGERLEVALEVRPADVRAVHRRRPRRHRAAGRQADGQPRPTTVPSSRRRRGEPEGRRAPTPAQETGVRRARTASSPRGHAGDPTSAGWPPPGAPGGAGNSSPSTSSR